MAFRRSLNSCGYLCSAVIAPSAVKSAHGDKNDKSREAGWDRIMKIFVLDEFGGFSPELSHIYRTTITTAFFGACYGGFVFARNAYLDFIERNEATKFRTHFEAKKELQNYVTVNFAKGAFKWSWRLALFGGLYVSYVTASAAYRGEPSILDYTLGGMFSGAVYKINLGLRGVIIGGTVGSLLGLTAGCFTLNLLKLTGISMDDIYKWEEEKYEYRERHIKEAKGKSVSEEHHRNMLLEHDKRVFDDK